MIEAFTRIGQLVEQRWRARDYDECVFPDLATRALDELAPADITPMDLLRWAIGATAMPEQLDPTSNFGQPPLTLFRTSRFVVDVLFWLDGTTDIHQHGFSGAFHVLAGSSVHSRYKFDLHERIASTLLLGKVELDGFELLERGDTRPIGAGDHLIHGLFHLDRPSVTLVVRTLPDVEAGVQYRYLPPSIAENPFWRDTLLQRRLESLATLHELDPVTCESVVVDTIEAADFYTVFRVARDHLDRTRDVARVCELLERARPRHGQRIDALQPAFETIMRTTAIRAKRALLTHPEHRFFLALLMNLPTRAAILEGVARRFPDRDPVELIVGWLGDLADAMLARSSTESVEQLTTENDHSFVVVGELLRGHSGEQLITRMKEQFDDEDVERARAMIGTIEQSLRDAWLLRALFR